MSFSNNRFEKVYILVIIYNMRDIKDIIANNLSTLRKKNNLTQSQLAEKLNYSDNAVSRWEHGEVTPSIETLEQISEVFNVPLRALIEDNAVKQAEVSDRKQLINTLAIMLISVSLLWLVATIIFVCTKIISGIYFWQIFCWIVPIASLIMYPFHKYWGRHIYKFVIFSITLWSLLACIYIQFHTLNSWLWLIFIIGAPIEIALAIWAFIKPKPKVPKKKQKTINPNDTNNTQEKTAE